MRLFVLLITLLLGSQTLLFAKPSLKFGVFAYSSDTMIQQQYQPVIDYLNAHLTQNKVELVILDRVSFDAQLQGNQLDIISTNPSHFEAIRNNNMFIRTIATTKKAHNGIVTDSFGGVIFTRASNDALNTIEDLRSSSIASMDILSLGAYQAQILEFSERGMDITKNLTLMKAQNDIVRSVVEGKYEAGFVRTGLIESEISNGRLKKSEIKIINEQEMPYYPYLLSTRLYPEWPVAVLPNISDKEGTEIAILLLKFSLRADQDSPIYGFTLPQNYTSIEHLAKTLGLPPYDTLEEVTLEQVYHQYRSAILVALVLMLVITMIVFKIISLNFRIRSSEERFELAIEGTADGLFDWNMTDNTMFHSKHFETMLGYSGSELPQTLSAWEDLVHPEDKVQTYHTLDLYLGTNGEGVYDTVFRMKAKDGSWRWIRGRGKALFNAKGKAVRLVGFNSDITDKKESEKQLLLQTKHAQMGEMIGMIAHQWRQPLSAISATVSTLQVQKELHGMDEMELDEGLQSITDLIQHLSKTINDFREFFKEDKQIMEIRLDRLVEDSINIIQSILTSKGIALSVEYLCDEEISTYQNEIKQVLLNIIKNAQDALEEKKILNPVITIKTYKTDGKYCISVEDNAGGISEDIMDKIFEPYFTTKDSFNGTGLGLYMSKTIIEGHCKGTLKASNTDKGALLTICVNRSADQEQ